MADLAPFHDLVDGRADEYIARLAVAVAIPSVSSDPAHRPDCLRMIAHVREWMSKLGVESELRELGKQSSQPDLDLPPVVLARYGSDPAKLTVGVYGHLDVQPASKSDGWTTDPWVLTQCEGGKMAGRGSTDDKGPVLGWLWALEAHQSLGLELPVNLVFCLESMEESGSEGLQQLIEREAEAYFALVDCWCITDTYWTGTKKPCIQYGLRGICYFFVTVAGLEKDLHSGRGGAVHEPMLELVRLLAGLQDPASGRILVPGVEELMVPVADAERASFEGIDIDMSAFTQSLGAPKLRESTKVDILERTWRRPSLSIHGVQGAFSGQGCKTVIPGTVVGKVSIRLVDGMDPEQVEVLVRRHLTSEFEAMRSPNQLEVKMEHAAASFCQRTDDFNFSAGRRATEKVHGVAPDLVRSGGTIPVTLMFQQTGKSVLLLAIGRADDGQHGPNEKLDRSNYIQGIKLVGTYLHELGASGQKPRAGGAVPGGIGQLPRKRIKFCQICSTNWEGCRCCV